MPEGNVRLGALVACAPPRIEKKAITDASSDELRRRASPLSAMANASAGAAGGAAGKSHHLVRDDRARPGSPAVAEGKCTGIGRNFREIVSNEHIPQNVQQARP